MVGFADVELFNVELCAVRNVEFCNRLCRLPEQEF